MGDGNLDTGIDMHEPFLGQLAESTAAAGVEDRVTTMQADMASVPFEPDSSVARPA